MKKKLLIGSVVCILLIAGWIVWQFIYAFNFQKPPEFLDIRNPNNIFIIGIDKGVCTATGKSNMTAMNKDAEGNATVTALSNDVDLKKYVGKRVKLKGEFISYHTTRLTDCRLKPENSINGYALLEIKSLELVK